MSYFTAARIDPGQTDPGHGKTAKQRYRNPLMRSGRQDSERETRLQLDVRKSLPAPITVLRSDREGGSKTFFGYAKNISRSGMMIGATSPREPGSRFLLEIPLPEPVSLTVTCECEVVWIRRWAKRGCHEPGMGLRFLDLPENVGDAIDEWIRALALDDCLWN